MMQERLIERRRARKHRDRIVLHSAEDDVDVAIRIGELATTGWSTSASSSADSRAVTLATICSWPANFRVTSSARF